MSSVPDKDYIVPLTPDEFLRQEIERGLFLTELFCPVRPKRRGAEALEEAWKLPVPELPEISDYDEPDSTEMIQRADRPDFGTVGPSCRVRANHFLVQICWNDIHRYNVSIFPEVKDKSIIDSVIAQLFSVKKKLWGKKLPIYDWQHSLYTAGALPFKSEDSNFTWYNPNNKEDMREFKVHIELAGWVDLRHLQNFVDGKRNEVPQDAIKMFDLVFRETASQYLTKVSRSLYSRGWGATDLGNGIECWKGYYLNICPTQMGVTLNFDTSAAAFCKSIPVVQFVREFLNIHNLNVPLAAMDRIKLERALKGVCVEATHSLDKVQRYKISAIPEVSVSDTRFYWEKEKRVISVNDYFKERYNYDLKYTDLPCLQSGHGTRVLLPMEVCNIIVGQKFSSKLDKEEVTALLKASCKRPSDRKKNISAMLLSQNFNDDRCANEFGVNLISYYVGIDAHVLPPPTLKYHYTSEQKSCIPREGEWSMFGKKMFKGGTIENWACINFSFLESKQIDQFCDEVFGICNALGMNCAQKPIMETSQLVAEDCQVQLRCYLELKKRPLDILIIILPEIGDVYGMIKCMCETEFGIVTQCCRPSSIEKRSKQSLSNLALKINVNVGGVNTVLEGTLSGTGRINNPFLTDKPTIIFGADVSHPPPYDDLSSSIAAVVASMDWPTCTKYKGVTCAQRHRQEIISGLFTKTKNMQQEMVYGGMVRELLLSFYSANGYKPERIIFYRDGVGEGQFAQVLLHEMDAIRKACQSLEENYLPPITFVVVQKRHHTRLFPESDRSDGLIDKSENILPGTVVDRDICHPSKFDFFLCSHAGIRGTSRPAHYHVLFDENRYTANDLQVMTNNLCFIYARCTRSVSIVAPVYYAHLLASRARHYLHRFTGKHIGPLEFHDKVKQVMFYC